MCEVSAPVVTSQIQIQIQHAAFAYSAYFYAKTKKNKSSDSEKQDITAGRNLKTGSYLVPLCWVAGAAGDTEQACDTEPEGRNDRGQAEVTGGACASVRARADA